MGAFAAAWPDRAIMQQLAAQMPWAHNCVLLNRVKDAKTREFYIRETVGQGWSRSVLVHHLDTDLHKRAGRAPSNFALTLPSEQSDLAKELLIFSSKLGSGFAFVGNQYRLEVDGEEFFLDLLFYHTRLSKLRLSIRPNEGIVLLFLVDRSFLAGELPPSYGTRTQLRCELVRSQNFPPASDTAGHPGSTAETHLINREPVRCQRFGGAARHEEEEYPPCRQPDSGIAQLRGGITLESMTTISLKLPNELLRRLERESRARRTTKSSLVRECLEKQLPERDLRADLPPLPPGKSVYDHAAPILKRVWARRGRGARDLASNPKYMEGFGK
jgi:predicted nuclease of restriction endonuclease-like (RecB) superfamily